MAEFIITRKQKDYLKMPYQVIINGRPTIDDYLIRHLQVVFLLPGYNKFCHNNLTV